MDKKFKSQELDLVIYKEKPTLVPKGETIPNLLREGKLGMLWFVYQSNLEEYIRQFKGYEGPDAVYLVNCFYEDLRDRHYIGVREAEKIEQYEEEDLDTSGLDDPDDYYVKEEELDPVIEQFREILYSIQSINYNKISRLKYYYANNWYDLKKCPSKEEVEDMIKDCFLKPGNDTGLALAQFTNNVSDYNTYEILPSFYQLYRVDEDNSRIVGLNADLDYTVSVEDICENTGEFLSLLSGIFKATEKYYIYAAENKLLLNRDWDVQIYGQNKNALTIKRIAFAPWNRGNFLFDVAKGIVPGWKLIPTKGTLNCNNREISTLAEIAYREADPCCADYRLAAPYDLQFLTKDKDCFVGNEQAWKWYKKENTMYPGLYYGEYNQR